MRIVQGRALNREVERVTARRQELAQNVDRRVRTIIDDVRRSGDSALRKYGKRWDGLKQQDSFKVPEKELKRALASVDPEFRSALEKAAANIRQFCQWQKPAEFLRTIQPGIKVGQIIRPLEAVGCYVPGGRYPLPSSLLMTVIPAQVAGVRRVVVASPKPAAETLAAAALLGVAEFYRIGGAQAIAALAYGTEAISKVNKIVGPGNIFVTTAKKLVAFDCSIDFLAGPTEAVVVSDKGNPKFIAADLVAQAEHDPEALGIFITASAELAQRVGREIELMSAENATASQSLREYGVIFVTSSRRESLQIANRLAPEHISIAEEDLPLIQNSGSVFIGDYSAQTLGDYIAGPNHVLPTSGTATYRGGLSVCDFLKVISVQQVSRSGLRAVASQAITLAKAEGLAAHANSVAVRCTGA
ncbi:MAG: histidinol dehydrogenase [Acidobacteria bacterium]|nr:MAG: histidinol dehydrogenase [Acidobacteriota bacterium]